LRETSVIKLVAAAPCVRAASNIRTVARHPRRGDAAQVECLGLRRDRSSLLPRPMPAASTFGHPHSYDPSEWAEGMAGANDGGGDHAPWASAPLIAVDATAALHVLLIRSGANDPSGCALASASGPGSIPPPGGRPIWLPREFADSCIRGRGKPIGIEAAIRQMKQIIATGPDSIHVT
jgi:hypothetical protein